MIGLKLKVISLAGGMTTKYDCTLFKNMNKYEIFRSYMNGLFVYCIKIEFSSSYIRFYEVFLFCFGLHVVI